LDAPELVHATLDEQLRAPTAGEFDARFAKVVPNMPSIGLTTREQILLERIGDQVLPLNKVLRTRMEHSALNRLVDRGIVQVAGVTPSDASHLLGLVNAWDKPAAEKALALFARKRLGHGNMVAANAESLARMIVDQLTEQTALTMLETAFAEEVDGFDTPVDQLARHVLTRRGLAKHRGLIALDAALNVDVVGLGASAASYYPAVGEHLHCRMILPEHAGVANAIGAVVGRVAVRRGGTVTSPAEGRFRVHLDDGPRDFGSAREALETLEQSLTAEARLAAEDAGAEDIQVWVERDIRTAEVETSEVFVEGSMVVEASGRPRVAA
jgi:N-methylhydantoinase A/oxoprolinase/acetone carboxylase beta subunit